MMDTLPPSPPPIPVWQEELERHVERAKREVRYQAETARRSLGQHVRYARERLAKLREDQC